MGRMKMSRAAEARKMSPEKVLIAWIGGCCGGLFLAMPSIRPTNEKKKETSKGRRDKLHDI